jgi:hypothetical protein
VEHTKAYTTKSRFTPSASTARNMGDIATHPEPQLRSQGTSTSKATNSSTVSTTYLNDTIRPIPEVCMYESYAYMPLFEKDIRLIRLRPSLDETSKIEVDLIHIPLDSARVLGYIALSYTWGSMNTFATILVDGKLLKVGPNVQRILIRLRCLGLEYIWVRT